MRIWLEIYNGANKQLECEDSNEILMAYTANKRV